jgi:4-hydroxy-tetrahydrodipicolinate synthase
MKSNQKILLKRIRLKNSMKNNLIKPLRGIIPPMVTPLIDNDRLDINGLEKLIEHIIAGNVNGIFVLGTTGEAPSLNYPLRYELIERVTKKVAKRLPVFIGITDTSCRESLKIAEFSAKNNADAVVLAPPYYFPAGQTELLEYIEYLAPNSPLPLLLYNMPSCTKINIVPETVANAAQIENVIGIKDSSCNMLYFHKLRMLFLKDFKFTILTGAEELLAETVFFGGHGGVCGGANLFPSLYVKLYEAAIQGNIDRCRKIQEILMTISTTLYKTGKHKSSVIKGIKCSLSIMGICNDYLAEPFNRFKETERKKINNYLLKIQKQIKLV